MTKEELRKEAEEWLSITDNHLNDERTHFLSESEYAEQAYLAGAEPREKLLQEKDKKIEELEKSCDETQKLLDKQIEATLKLDKENAELKKEWQEQVQKATDEGYARTLQTIQLTKAKEIITELLKYTDTEAVEMIKEAEQFLNEVEK